MTMRVSTSSRSGLVGAATTLEGERARHDTDGQRAELLGDAGHDGRATGAGATALAGGHEDHVGALEDLLDLLGVVLGGLLADLGVGAGAQAAGELTTHVELDVGIAHQQRLRVGVDRDELDALEADLDHPVDRVDTAAADADDLDDGQVVLGCCHGAGLSLPGVLLEWVFVQSLDVDLTVTVWSRSVPDDARRADRRAQTPRVGVSSLVPLFLTR
jgi:hypothetical protein